MARSVLGAEKNWAGTVSSTISPRSMKASARADVAGKVHLMGDDQHGHALARQLAHDHQHLAAQLRVERRGRLVEQQHLGRHGKRAGDGDALLLAAREARRVGIALVGKADLVQQLLGHGDRLGLRHGLDADRRLDDVFEHGHVWP